MDYEVLYKLDFAPLQWDIFLIPISIIFIGVYAIRLIKKYGFRHPMQSWGFFPNLNFSLFAKFFAFIIAFFGIIILIVMLVQIPIEIAERRSVTKQMKQWMNGQIPSAGK